MNNSATHISITTADQDPCPGCDGKGYQMGSNGITITCPMCNGSGVWSKSIAPYPYYVYHDPYDYNPWFPTCEIYFGI